MSFTAGRYEQAARHLIVRMHDIHTCISKYYVCRLVSNLRAKIRNKEEVYTHTQIRCSVEQNRPQVPGLQVGRVRVQFVLYGARPYLSSW